MSSVSPERCETTADQPAPRASAIASIVSVSVPIWLSLMRTEFAASSSIARAIRSVLVTSRSSPTSWMVRPEPLGQVPPALPVVLGEAVLERDDRVARGPVGPQVDQLARVERPALACQHVARRRAVDARCPPRPARSSPDRARSRRRRPAGSRPSRSPAGSPRPRPRSTAATARSRPRRPGRSQWPSSWRMPRSAQKTSEPARSASAYVPTPTGMTMNSWKSVESWACLPPLRMLNIGNRQVHRPDAAEVAIERQVVGGGGGVGTGERDAEDRVRAEPALVRRCRRARPGARRCRPGRTRRARTGPGRSCRSRWRPPGARPCHRTAPGRRRAARPPRGRRSRRRTGPPRGRPNRRTGRRRPRPSGCRANRGSRGRRCLR